MEPQTENEHVLVEEETQQVESGEGEFIQDSDSKPALTINIQSWATPVVGLVMLLVGLLGGYLVRPYIPSESPEAAPVVAAPGPNTSTGAPDTTVADAASRQEMMDFLISQTRHFRGDPEAAVTIIEFSDFQ